MWLLSPLNWLLLALAFAWPAWRLRQRMPWVWPGCLALSVIALLTMTPLVANALLIRLEYLDRVDPACATSPPSVVVVLAGGIDRLPRDARDFEALGIASRRRLDSGLAYWRAAPGRELVITGGPPAAGQPAESQLMSAYALAAGVPFAAMRLETQATSTWQNAQGVARLQPAIAPRIALATSAMHMARARLAFAAAGFGVCPLASDTRFTEFGLPEALLPRSSALRKSEAAIHEIVGWSYYWLRARLGNANGSVGPSPKVVAAAGPMATARLR